MITALEVDVFFHVQNFLMYGVLNPEIQPLSHRRPTGNLVTVTTKIRISTLPDPNFRYCSHTR